MRNSQYRIYKKDGLHLHVHLINYVFYASTKKLALMCGCSPQTLTKFFKSKNIIPLEDYIDSSKGVQKAKLYRKIDIEVALKHFNKIDLLEKIKKL